jgi:hypothetical protein
MAPIFVIERDFTPNYAQRRHGITESTESKERSDKAIEDEINRLPLQFGTVEFTSQAGVPTLILAVISARQRG